MVSQIIKKQIDTIEYKGKRTFQFLFSFSIFFIISYGFLLNSTMMNTVSKQNMEKEMTSLSSEVNVLEFQYLNIKKSITLEFAKSKGFVVVASDQFATIDPVKQKISLSVNEN